jgi:hypothetical protein
MGAIAVKAGPSRDHVVFCRLDGPFGAVAFLLECDYRHYRDIEG